MPTDIKGRLNVNWDSYWKGFICWPPVEALRAGVIKRAYSRILDGVRLGPSPRICELGAGTGTVSRFLGERFSAGVTVVDNNPAALQFLRQTFSGFPHETAIVAKDVFDLTDLQGRFDLVHSGGLIEHFTGPSRSLIIKAHCDLVKDTGRLVIFVPTPNGWYRVLNEGVFKWLHLLDEIPEQPWPLAELSAALKANGFKIIRHTQTISELGVLAERFA